MSQKSEDTVREHQWISSDTELVNLCGQLKSVQWLAVDTEFVRTNTFYPVPGLVQLYDGERVYLVDPLPITDWSPLSGIFAQPDILKVLHACGEDLELFFSLGIQQPQPLFDTQVAAAMLGGELNEGLQNLVNRNLDLHLTKHETRSDWTLRPLSDEQIRYAKEDVVILLPLFEKQKEALLDRGQYDLVLAEGDLMGAQAANPIAEDVYYLKLRGGWKLRKHAQSLLATLASWREREAKARNIPRRRICTDDDLIQLAMRRPESLGQITQCTKLMGSQLRKFGKLILELVKEDEAREPAGDEFVMIRPPLPKSAKELYQQVREMAQSIASEKGINPGLLASRSMLEELVDWYLKGQAAEQPALLRTWRGDILGSLLMDVLQTGEDDR
ncbi:ribonuclease D [Hahella sp. CCB-MM4]|uniref:ribonuclease D n=1 Tax=Hahella sp. (strain CCB-MM4) TaxID=1926491 RepID=UPI000B9BC606|nr:ribonuclease D [Hahella sp. CCB-MM4]OZG73523.1 ribonuclease D [Hahella sp. CCB-MM4]